MNWRVPLSDLTLTADDEAAVVRVLRSGWLTMGPEVEAFEAEFAAFIGTKHAVALASATAALHLALVAAGVGPGDEVVLPSLTFVASANMTRTLGAIPVFADICSLQQPFVDVAAVEPLVTSRTRAIVAMAYGGLVPPMRELRALADRRGVALIEDACHGIGAACEGRRLGAWGDAAAFSFFPNKNMTTGEGGMLTTDRDDIAERARRLRSHGLSRATWERHRAQDGGYEVAEAGWNYRMDEMRAALGRTQLARLFAMNAARSERAARYDRLLAASPLDVGQDGAVWLAPGAGDPAGRAAQACHIFPLLVPRSVDRVALAEALARGGVQTSHHYPPVHRFGAYANVGRSAARPDLEQTEDFARREITLPLWPGIGDEQQALVVSLLVEAEAGSRHA